MPWPETLDDFRDGGAIEPELCFVTSVAVAFPASRRNDGPGPGTEFRDWSLRGRRQFHPAPARVAAAFAAGHGERAARHAPAVARPA